MIYLYWIVGIYLFTSFVYVWYLGMARLNIARKENPEKLTKTVIFFALPFALIGLVADALFNIVIGTVLFLELPEFDRILFTARISKWANKSGYRKPLARWFCLQLDKFDWRGKHCSCFEPVDDAPKCQQ